MNVKDQAEVQKILELSRQISRKLDDLGFAGDSDVEGNIVHHLAEVAVMGEKLAHESLPSFLKLAPHDKEVLGDIIVGIKYELDEVKEAIEDMEPALIKLMNFLTKD